MFAGNILVDVVKNIWKYPQKGTLASITDVSRSVGGLVPNTAINLAKIDRSIPLCAIGRVGDDEYGRYVTGRMEHFGIDTKYVKVSPTAPTSFSDVMSEPQGERTFFHARGANAEFNPNDVNLNTLPGKILHIGYILLLDCFDRADAEYGTVMGALPSRGSGARYKNVDRRSERQRRGLSQQNCTSSALLRLCSD